MKNSSCRYVVSLAGFILILVTVSAEATTLTVRSASDAGGTCPGATCTLRQAIATAVAGDTIDFNLTGTITLTSGALVINKNLVIAGPGASKINVAGVGTNTIVQITSGNVTISGLTIGPGYFGVDLTGGTLTMNDCAVSGNIGSGGLLAESGTTLNMNRCTISGNQTGFTGGGLENNVATATLTNCTISGNTSKNTGMQSGVGGGVDNTAGTLTLINCTVTGNTAENSGGGISSPGSGTFQLINTIVSNNSSPNGPDCSGTFVSNGYNLIRINGGTGFTNNVKHDQVGTVATPREPLLGPLQDNGGPTKTHALLSGSPAIEAGNSSASNTDERGFARPVDSPSIANVGDGSDIGAYEVQADVLPGCSSINRIVKNKNDSGTDSLRGVIAGVCAGSTITFAPNITGAIPLTSGELLVNKSLTIVGPGPDILLYVLRSQAPGTSKFRVFNIASNVNVAISGLQISNGNADSDAGGGISNNGTLSLTNVVVGFNSALLGGGGIYNPGVLTLTNSIVFGNATNSGGGGISSSGTLTVTNSTISQNSGNSGNGGGLVNSGTTTIRSSTVTGNTLGSGAGGGVHNFSGTVNVRNSIIALNTATSAPDYNGALTSQGFNLIGNSSGATISPALFTDQIGSAGAPLDPMLGPLHDDVGVPITPALLPGSPAIDKGDSGGLTTDQRGFPRPVDLGSIANATGADGADIGAFELQATPVLIPGTSSSVALGDTVGDFATLSGGSSPTGTITFQLFGPNDNTCSGAAITTFTYNVSGNAGILTGPFTPTAVGVYNWVVTYSGDAANVGVSTICGLPNQTFTVTQTVLANISTRLRVETGDNALIAGFIITGTQPKKVIILGIGSSLGLADQLANPTLELHDSQTLLNANDDWMNSSPADKQAIIDTTIPPTDPLESAIVATLPANNSNYTAVLRGVNNGTGIGVIQIYDLDRLVDSKLANISTRGLVQTGDNVLFAGTIVLGQASQKVIIRALGPSTGVSGSMADPTLELRDGQGAVLEANDNWVDSPNKQAILDSTIPPTNDKESAIVYTLPAGGANYTAIVRGANNTTGIAVVEVYVLN